MLSMMKISSVASTIILVLYFEVFDTDPTNNRSLLAGEDTTIS